MQFPVPCYILDCFLELDITTEWQWVFSRTNNSSMQPQFEVDFTLKI